MTIGIFLMFTVELIVNYLLHKMNTYYKTHISENLVEKIKDLKYFKILSKGGSSLLKMHCNSLSVHKIESS